MIVGVGPDAPIETNAAGGQQSKPASRLDLIPAAALLRIGGVFQYGLEVRGYPRDNWKKIEAASHVNKALIHAYAWLAGDTSDDHVGHFGCRAVMAVQMAIEEGKAPLQGTAPTPPVTAEAVLAWLRSHAYTVAARLVLDAIEAGEIK